MTGKSILIFGIGAAMIAGVGGFLGVVRNHQKLSNPGVKLSPAPIYGVHGQLVGTNSVYLPERVSNFTSKPVPIDDKILEWLPKDTTFGQRLYQAVDGFTAQMGVVLMGTDRTSLHRPQFCLPAQGWTIDQQEVRLIPVAQPNSYSLPVMKLTAHKEVKLPDGRIARRSAVYVYWFVSAEQITAQNQDYMWSILRHLLLKGELERWAYVNCFTSCPPGEEEKAYRRAQELIAAAVPHFQLVAGGRGTSQPAKNAKGLAYLNITEGSR